MTEQRSDRTNGTPSGIVKPVTQLNMALQKSQFWDLAALYPKSCKCILEYSANPWFFNYLKYAE